MCGSAKESCITFAASNPFRERIVTTQVHMVTV
jgi:hypothetical protein